MTHRAIGGFVAWVLGVASALGCSWIALRSVGQELGASGDGNLTATVISRSPAPVPASPSTGLASGVGEPLPAPTPTRPASARATSATPTARPAPVSSATAPRGSDGGGSGQGDGQDEPDQSVVPSDEGSWWVGGGQPSSEAVRIPGGQVVLECDLSRLLDFEARPLPDWLVRVARREEGRVWFTFRHSTGGEEILVLADCTGGYPQFTARLVTG